MRYIALKDDFYLVEQEIPKQVNIVTVPEPINHIWVYDRSYSMSNDLPNLVQDLILRAKQLPVGDTLTLGWFSSEGQYNFIIKGYKITDSMDYLILEKAIEKNKTPIGATCFSEILQDLNTVVEDLAIISSNFALCFFTDGYPVVSDIRKEHQNIQKAIEAVEGKINATLLIGYGNYYNKELMTKMAEWFGGTLVHSNSLSSFSITLTEFVDDSRDSSPKRNIKLPVYTEGLIFSISGKNVNVYESKNGFINFAPSKKAKDYVYIVSSSIPVDVKEVVFTDLNVKGKSSIEPMVKAVYALAYILTQRTKTDVALTVLSVLGDKDILDSVVNAFTNDEYGRVEHKILTAMSRPSKRFINGRSVSYLPPEDAFSLLDIIYLLQTDENAYFYPRHEKFSYSRIGSESTQVDEKVSFIADSDVKCAMSSLSWNAKKLNLSVLAHIKGKVRLKEGYKEQGFQEYFPTHVYRNYALVKDGFPNVRQLPVSVSQLTFGKLKAEGVIDAELSWEQDAIYLLHLDRVPVVNRGAAKGRTSAIELCTKIWKEWELKGTLKALKAYRDKLLPTKAAPFGGLSTTQQEFLAEHYITANGFSPKVERVVEPTDFYYAKEFEIKVKGVTSLPKLESVLDKKMNNKSLTKSESLVDLGIQLYERSGLASANSTVQLAWLTSTIEQKNTELFRVRKDIQETKFAVLLAKAWFDEFESRDANTLTIQDTLYTITVKEVKVLI
jgi:hypothetical protein